MLGRPASPFQRCEDDASAVNFSPRQTFKPSAQVRGRSLGAGGGSPRAAGVMGSHDQEETPAHRAQPYKFTRDV